jgi:predicted ester cyclase
MRWAILSKPRSRYRAVFPDLAIRVDDQITEGDRVVSRWTLEAHTTGGA